MSDKVVASVPAVPAVKPAVAKDKRPCLAKTRAGVSRDAQRVAAAVLEVLAGVRTPSEAAEVMELSVPRYYLWEQRALEGLVRACEARPVGKAVSERRRIAVLEKEVSRLRQECTRQQALVRAAQRTIGLAACADPRRGCPAAAKPATKGAKQTDAKTVAEVGDSSKRKRKRRPVARALKVAATLREPVAEEALVVATDCSSSIAVQVVQRSVPSSSLNAADAALVAALSPP
jgi:hypothetical protein